MQRAKILTLIGSILLLSSCASLPSGSPASSSSSMSSSMNVSTNSLQSSMQPTSTGVEDPPVVIEPIEEVSTSTQTGAATTVRMLDVGTLLIGSETATTTLTAFLDYNCDYCHQFGTQALPALTKGYIATGKMNMILMYLPLAPAGINAAKAAICSIEQNTFIDFHSKLIAGYPTTEASMTKLAKDLKMDTAKWNKCRASEFADGILKTHQAFAESKNVTRVPSFIVGDDQWVGIISVSQWKERIEKALGTKQS